MKGYNRRGEKSELRDILSLIVFTFFLLGVEAKQMGLSYALYISVSFQFTVKFSSVLCYWLLLFGSEMDVKVYVSDIFCLVVNPSVFVANCYSRQPLKGN